MPDHAMKTPPPYAIASVDHALRLATILQIEGSLSVTEAAERLGVARSTAHRLLAMLVYRDFAAREDRRYRAGPVLELAAHSRSAVARLREAALPHLRRLVDHLHETVNLIVRTGANARFVASLEGDQTLRLGSREGMVFPAHRTTGGLLLLAELSEEELEAVYAGEEPEAGEDAPPDLDRLRAHLEQIRRCGYAVNQGLSERGVTAVGVLVRDSRGTALGSLAVALPTVRYEPEQLPRLVATLQHAAAGVEADLAEDAPA